MKKYLTMLPSNFGRLLFGVWIIGMALTLSGAPVHIESITYQKVLGIILAVAGVFTLLGR